MLVMRKVQRANIEEKVKEEGLEKVVKFKYLGIMMSVDIDKDE